MRFYLCHEVALRCFVCVYASYAKSLFLISYYHRPRSLSYDNIDVVDEFSKWLQLAAIVDERCLRRNNFVPRMMLYANIFFHERSSTKIAWIGDTCVGEKTFVSRIMALFVSELRSREMHDAGSRGETLKNSTVTQERINNNSTIFVSSPRFEVLFHDFPYGRLTPGRHAIPISPVADTVHAGWLESGKSNYLPCTWRVWQQLRASLAISEPFPRLFRETLTLRYWNDSHSP